MNLVNLLKGLLNLQKKVDIKSLPSQGLFYNNDFEIIIKKANVGDIIEYEHDYIKDDLGLVITKLKKIVEKNTTFSSGYNFNNIKSIDVVFIFLEQLAADLSTHFLGNSKLFIPGLKYNDAYEFDICLFIYIHMLYS